MEKTGSALCEVLSAKSLGEQASPMKEPAGQGLGHGDHLKHNGPRLLVSTTGPNGRMIDDRRLLFKHYRKHNHIESRSSD
ncbi:hypothetical protein HYQ46_005115 [Verticillium longisporum]|nr:hypothetical protein HYQ46_005115 [Verticillium longisporum]